MLIKVVGTEASPETYVSSPSSFLTIRDRNETGDNLTARSATM